MAKLTIDLNDQTGPHWLKEVTDKKQLERRAEKKKLILAKLKAQRKSEKKKGS